MPADSEVEGGGGTGASPAGGNRNEGKRLDAEAVREGLADRALGVLRRGSALLGGPARARVVLVLGATLALRGADIGTVTATAGNLKQAFHISNTQIGLLVAVTTAAAAFGTIPIGVLTDHMRRTRLLAMSVTVWALAMIFAGAAPSFSWLILSRMALGAVTATSGPTVASLIGDYFPARSRARMLGYILGGELVGTGVGVLVSGEISALLSWRWAFWWLLIPSAVIAWYSWRLPEPARDGQTRLQPGQTDIPDERDVDPTERPEADQDDEQQRGHSVAQLAEHKHVTPRRGIVLTEDPTHRSLWWAVRYVLAVPTNRVLILTSALGYFYFSGLRSFAVIFVQQHYHVPESIASPLVVVIGLGALVGVWLGGRTADKLLAREVIIARVFVPTVALVGVVILLAPAVWTTTLAIALPLLIAGAGFLGATNPPLDAARLDIIHPALWGRGEAVRTFLRSLAEAGAPPLFGWASQSVFGGPSGLEYTFLLFLITLIAAVVLSFTAWKTYPRDVSAAAQSHRREPTETS